jgi:hypothetical protein
MWKGLDVGDINYYAAMASFLAAVVWGTKYLVLTGRLIVGKLGGPERKR